MILKPPAKVPAGSCSIQNTQPRSYQQQSLLTTCRFVSWQDQECFSHDSCRGHAEAPSGSANSRLLLITSKGSDESKTMIGLYTRPTQSEDVPLQFPTLCMAALKAVGSPHPETWVQPHPSMGRLVHSSKGNQAHGAHGWEGFPPLSQQRKMRPEERLVTVHPLEPRCVDVLEHGATGVSRSCGLPGTAHVSLFLSSNLYLHRNTNKTVVGAD